LKRGRLGGREPVHVSLHTRRDVPSLRSQVCFTALRRAFAAGKEKFGFRLVHFSVQGNHVHFVVEADDNRALSRGMQGLAIRMARGVNGAVGRKGSVFAERFHAKPLGSPRQVRAALVYVLRNHVKHDVQHGGRVSSELDPCSSARWFDGWRTRAPCSDDQDERPVVVPRTWLLGRGWQLLGKIDDFEIPRL
jgi:REP element-mobilizing transposase RayT